MTMAPFLNKINLGFLGSLGHSDGFVAFDIGSSSVKMVEAAADRNGWRLLNVGIVDLPPGAVQNNMVVDSQSVVDSISRLIKQYNVKSTKVISAVPGRAVIMKKFQLPVQQADELEANVEFEASKVIPENLENVNLDYQILNYPDGGSKVEILLVAVRKEIVKSYTDVIEQAGLIPSVMDVDYFAMENMYETPQMLTHLMNALGQSTPREILPERVLVRTADTIVWWKPAGQIVMFFSDRGGDAMLKKLNGKKYPDLEALLRPVAESLAEDIRRTLSLYGGVASEEGIRTIYVTGGAAKIRGLCGILAEKLGVPVQLADPFHGFRLDDKINKAYLGESASQLGIGVGLAIRRPGDK